MALYHQFGGCADVRSQADSAAEAEAAALEWFQRELGQPQPVPPLRRAAELRQLAAELGRDTDPPPRYPRGAMVKRWLKILDAIATGQPVRASRYSFTEPTTRAARAQRTETYRARRAAGLKRLASLPPDHPLTIREAGELAGLSVSGFEKALSAGRVRFIKQGRRTLIRAADVSAFLHKRCKVAA